MSDLITPAQRDQMLANAHITVDGVDGDDHYPVVKLFTPDGAATWLLTELDPDDPDLAFGLCDLGLGEPEIGYVSLKEIASIRGKLGLSVERDIGFKADMRLSRYAKIAGAAGTILT